MSNEKPPHQCAMQTDIPEIMQPDILGMKLTAVPITFVETDGGGNTTDPSDETLANAIKNMSRASPHDAKKKHTSGKRKSAETIPKSDRNKHKLRLMNTNRLGRNDRDKLVRMRVT